VEKKGKGGKKKAAGRQRPLFVDRGGRAPKKRKRGEGGTYISILHLEEKGGGKKEQDFGPSPSSPRS